MFYDENCSNYCVEYFRYHCHGTFGSPVHRDGPPSSTFAAFHKEASPRSCQPPRTTGQFWFAEEYCAGHASPTRFGTGSSRKVEPVSSIGMDAVKTAFGWWLDGRATTGWTGKKHYWSIQIANVFSLMLHTGCHHRSRTDRRYNARPRMERVRGRSCLAM